MQIDLPQPPSRQQWLWDRVSKLLQAGFVQDMQGLPANSAVEAWGFSAVPELSVLFQGAQQASDGRADDAGVSCRVPSTSQHAECVLVCC